MLLRYKVHLRVRVKPVDTAAKLRDYVYVCVYVSVSFCIFCITCVIQ